MKITTKAEIHPVPSTSLELGPRPMETLSIDEDDTPLALRKRKSTQPLVTTNISIPLLEENSFNQQARYQKMKFPSILTYSHSTKNF